MIRVYHFFFYVSTARGQYVQGTQGMRDLSFPLRSRYTTGQQCNLFDIDIFYRKSSLDELRVEPMESTPTKKRYKYTLATYRSPTIARIIETNDCFLRYGCQMIQITQPWSTSMMANL